MNYCKHGNDYYSYETCIRTTLQDGRTVGNVTKYSRVTSKHQGDANVLSCEILVDGVPRGTISEELRLIAIQRMFSQ